MGIDILTEDEAGVLLHFGEQVVESILFGRPVTNFTKQFFLGVREIGECMILVSLLIIGHCVLEHLFGVLLSLGILQLEASALLLSLFLCVLNVVFNRVLTQHILTKLQLILPGVILAPSC